MSKKDLMLKIFLPIGIILVGVIITFILIKTKSVPQRLDHSYSGPLVEVATIAETERQIIVPGTGTVQATQETDVTPQVSGRVVHISKRMANGGFFNRGELLFSIERIDYELALERARASLAQAELELMRNESLAEIAQLEWSRVDPDENRAASPLTLHEPQLKAAEAQVASAKSAVKQAELDLSRTAIRAPFNCYIRSEKVDVGQYVRAGTPVATVAGTNQVEIVVPLQLEELNWLQIPRNGKKIKGSDAVVRMFAGDRMSEWSGRLSRSLGEIDPRNRMAKVVVTVDDPFGKKGADDSTSTELVPGMFVEVLIHGKDLGNVIAIPRSALRDNDTVWIIDGENKLRIVSVGIARRERDELLVTSGVKSGDRLVLTAVAAAADGMLVRPVEQEPKP